MTAGETGEPVAHFLPSVILGASPGIQALPSLPSVKREAHREHQPGFPPSVRMTDGEGGENDGLGGRLEKMSTFNNGRLFLPDKAHMY